MLGVPRDATPEQVRGAYRRLVRQHHPDVNASPDAGERFRAVDAAYRQLAGEQASPAFEAPQPEQPGPPGEGTPPGRAPPGGPSLVAVFIGVAGICLSGPLLLSGFLAPVALLALILAAAALAGRRS